MKPWVWKVLIGFLLLNCGVSIYFEKTKQKKIPKPPLAFRKEVAHRESIKKWKIAGQKAAAAKKLQPRTIASTNINDSELELKKTLEKSAKKMAEEVLNLAIENGESPVDEESSLSLWCAGMNLRFKVTNPETRAAFEVLRKCETSSIEEQNTKCIPVVLSTEARDTLTELAAPQTNEKITLVFPESHWHLVSTHKEGQTKFSIRQAASNSGALPAGGEITVVGWLERVTSVQSAKFSTQCNLTGLAQRPLPKKIEELKTETTIERDQNDDQT